MRRFDAVCNTPPPHRFRLQETGMTALMEAAKVGFLELVQAILSKGADPNMVDANELTAVHYAAMGSFLEVGYLLAHPMPKPVYKKSGRVRQRGCSLRVFTLWSSR